MSIRFKNVMFSYKDRPDVAVLKIPHWEVTAGEHIFVHGPSGAGKSTLLNTVSGLNTPVVGEVTVFGERLDQLSAKARDRLRATKIGYVFQQFNLIPYLGAIDNIQLARYFGHSRRVKSQSSEVTNLLAKLNIPSADWSKPVAKLSIGQQQRVAIARALINRPQLLIADEPTSSLDQQNRDTFMSLLMSLVAEHQMTIVFVSHDLSLSSYFSRVDRLSDLNTAVST